MIHYLRALAARLRGLFGDRRADRELDDEIEMHLRLLTERYVRQGMTGDEAAWAARRQFGNITLLEEVNREMRGITSIETLVEDLRYGLWMPRKNLGFTIVPGAWHRREYGVIQRSGCRAAQDLAGPRARSVGVV
jgi:hypothetical protein